MLLTGSAFIGAWFFAGDALNLWVGSKLAGDDLARSHRILTILLGAQLISLPCGILRAFLFGSGKVKVPALIYLSEAISNLALSIVLCLSFGIEGVAWGTTIPVVVFELCVLAPYALRRMDVSVRRIVEEAFVPQVLPLLSLLAFAITVANYPASHGDWLALMIVAASGAGILGATLWLRRKYESRAMAGANG
jgi:O-antigen/teichoic acid export membrane protein